MHKTICHHGRELDRHEAEERRHLRTQSQAMGMTINEIVELLARDTAIMTDEQRAKAAEISKLFDKAVNALADLYRELPNE